MHGAERMLESRVLGGGENPPSALELVNAPEPLQPRAVHEVLLRRSSGHAARPALGDARADTGASNRPRFAICSLFLAGSAANSEGTRPPPGSGPCRTPPPDPCDRASTRAPRPHAHPSSAR